MNPHFSLIFKGRLGLARPALLPGLAAASRGSLDPLDPRHREVPAGALQV